MRAFVLTAPRTGSVQQVPRPVAAPGQVVVEVARAGVCGTDVELFTGEMSYLHTGQARYPLRIGHEWCGTVVSVGGPFDARWLGRRVTGDTMLGCGHCRRCVQGRQHVCADRFEIGIRRGWHGALAEQLLVPASALRALPESIDWTAGALVEPAGNALRAVQAAEVGPGRRLLIHGPGTIGLLALMFALELGAEVHVVGAPFDGTTDRGLALARHFGAHGCWSAGEVPELGWDAVIDATSVSSVPSDAVDEVEPGGRVVYIGLAGSPSLLDTRAMVLKDVTAVGILSASPGLDATIERFAAGTLRPDELVASTVGLDRVADVLSGWRPADAGAGPKIHIDPTR
jgi:threonine dehydrogenase-like Zn-dependent dehydrogenase